MSFKERLKSILQSEWTIALIFLFLFLGTHGYRFGWDDHCGEIPHLKSLIDPALYTHDPFVISLKQSFPTFFYRILARLISIDQIQTTYFILFLCCRYFLFFWIYKFWLLISRSKLEAFFCTLTAMVLVREQHFLYLTFSHAEFTFPFVFAGIYFFHKERFFLAATLLGIAVNFHAIYGLLPMVYMCAYLLVTCRKHGFMALIKSGLIFVACASPFLIFLFMSKTALWSQSLAQASTAQDWIELCRKYMPEHFFFPATFRDFSLKEIFSNAFLFLGAMEVFFFLGFLYLLNAILNPVFRQNLKSHIFALTALLLLGLCFVISYIIPNKFLIGMQLLRNAHFLLFILPGYVTLLLLRSVREQPLWACFIIGLSYPGLIPRDLLAALYALNILMLLLLTAALKKNTSRSKVFLVAGALAGSLLAIGLYIGFLWMSKNNPLRGTIFRSSLAVFLCLGAGFGLERVLKKQFHISKRLFIIVPLIVVTLGYVHARYSYSFRDKNTFDRFQDAWVDIQRQTKARTDKDAIILAPHDTIMGGFRIFSERNLICDDRDIGAFLAFDIQQVYQWEQRMKDIEAFKVMPTEDVRPALFMAIAKYNASHVVFPASISPEPSKTLELLYENPLFSLYKINRFR
jgi:hypothetical protein